jgi:hypothetical protein
MLEFPIRKPVNVAALVKAAITLGWAVPLKTQKAYYYPSGDCTPYIKI